MEIKISQTERDSAGAMLKHQTNRITTTGAGFRATLDRFGMHYVAHLRPYSLRLCVKCSRICADGSHRVLMLENGKIYGDSVAVSEFLEG